MSFQHSIILWSTSRAIRGDQAHDLGTRESQVNPFRVVIFASAEPQRVKQLIRHLVDSLPDVKLGVLYEYPGPPLTIEARLRPGMRFILNPGRIGTALGGLATLIRAGWIGLLDRVLRLLHAAPKYPSSRTLPLDELRDYAESKGVQFHLTEDSDSPASTDFVRRMEPDLGVIYDAQTREIDLFEIPRKGSIALEVHYGGDQRGAGLPGPTEDVSQWTELTISAYRGSRDTDARAVLGERTFPIQEYDTPESIAVKANLLEIECVVDVIRSEIRGCPGEQPQGSPGVVRKENLDHRVLQADRPIRRKQRLFRPRYGRPLVKLLARFLFYPRTWLNNRCRAANQNFPIVILFGHVIADRPKFMGISTDQFLRQVRYLKKHYKIATLPEAMEMIREGRVPAPTVVLTFDDGYEDNHLGLRAVIDAEEVPVALFVCTKNVQEHLPFDHDLNRGEMGFYPLSWDQLKDFERQGSTIGSHTRTHFDCGSIKESVLRSEIVGSQEDLRRHLGHDVPYFSFPWGYPKNMSSTALVIASETYRYLFAAYGEINEVRNGASPVLKRAYLPESLLELELSLQGILDFRRDKVQWPSNAHRGGTIGTEASTPPIMKSEVAGRS